ncbi:MAG: acyl-CoA dehydrogenase, partial [Pseudomonadota bacterium]|nr:acyl-CoA dehydrogenase [Pseudomonadota bacterium]
MDLNPGPEYIKFRKEVKSFLSKNNHMSSRASDSAYTADKESNWQEKLIKNGYAARTIPKEYGGFGAEPDVLK